MTTDASLNRCTALRTLTHEDAVWQVREVDARKIPGALGDRCLVFDSPEVIRRVWLFPANWWELDDDALWQYGEHRPRLSVEAEKRRHELDAAVQRAMESIDAARGLAIRMKAAAEANREVRAELRCLLQSCREERRAMRATVEAHASSLRQAGITAEDASMLIANAIREGATQAYADDGSLKQFQRDAVRWCAQAYQAA
jgi:hypothetical protein